MSKRDSAPRTRWFALLLTSALLTIWDAALIHAVWGGLDPGYVHDRADRPYPVRRVLTVCGIITLEFAALFAIIRPFSLSGPRRVPIAIAVFVPLWIAELFFISGWTDQAGYCYSNGFFLFRAVCLLSVAAVIAFLISRRRPEAITDNAF
jgi:hypothetical protein